MADTDPLEYRQRRHHDLDVQSHGLTLRTWTVSLRLDPLRAAMAG